MWARLPRLVSPSALRRVGRRPESCAKPYRVGAGRDSWSRWASSHGVARSSPRGSGFRSRSTVDYRARHPLIQGVGKSSPQCLSSFAGDGSPVKPASIQSDAAARLAAVEAELSDLRGQIVRSATEPNAGTDAAAVAAVTTLLRRLGRGNAAATIPVEEYFELCADFGLDKTAAHDLLRSLVADDVVLHCEGTSLQHVVLLEPAALSKKLAESWALPPPDRRGNLAAHLQQVEEQLLKLETQKVRHRKHNAIKWCHCNIDIHCLSRVHWMKLQSGRRGADFWPSSLYGLCSFVCSTSWCTTQGHLVGM